MSRWIAPALAFLVSLPACGLFVITLGPDVLAPIRFDRTFDTGALADVGCDDLVAGTGPGADVLPPGYHAEPAEGGCALVYEQADFPLLDEAAAQDANRAVDGRPIDAVESVAVVVEAVRFTDEAGTELALDDLVADVEVHLDGVRLLDAAAVRALPDRPARVELPEALREAVLDAIEHARPVDVALSARLVVDDARAAEIPATVRLEATLQPEVEVSLLDALFG